MSLFLHVYAERFMKQVCWATLTYKTVAVFSRIAESKWSNEHSGNTKQHWSLEDPVSYMYNLLLAPFPSLLRISPSVSLADGTRINLLGNIYIRTTTTATCYTTYSLYFAICSFCATTAVGNTASTTMCATCTCPNNTATITTTTVVLVLLLMLLILLLFLLLLYYMSFKF